MAVLKQALEQVAALVPPAWVLAALLAMLNVFVFHMALAREGRSPFYLAPFGVLGFAVGNLLGQVAGSPLPTLGDVHVIEASIGAWAILSLANARRASA